MKYKKANRIDKYLLQKTCNVMGYKNIYMRDLILNFQMRIIAFRDVGVLKKSYIMSMTASY